jgi:hypothetical protein
MAAVADGVAFMAVLGCNRFKDTTQTVIVKNGLTMKTDLSTTDDKSLNYLGKHLVSWADPTFPADDQVRVPLLVY